MSRGRLWLAALALAVGPVLVYALVVLAQGTPGFPSRDDCARTATADAPDLEVVYGRFDDVTRAEDLLGAVTEIGFVGSELELDACGRWKVSYDAIESYAQGAALAEQAREAGFEASVESGG